MTFMNRRIALIALTLTGLCAQTGFGQKAAQIQQAIQQAGANWVAGPTTVSELPPEVLCGSILHPDAVKAIAAKSSAKASSSGPLPSGYPAAFDWRTYNGHNWVTGIRNQNPCGSCYILGTCGAAEAAMRVQAGSLGYLANPDFSEQFILSCNSWSCAGGYSGDTLSFLRDSGAPNEACFPYTAQDTTPCSNRCSNWADKIQRITNWGHPGGYPNWVPTTDQIKSALQTYGPCSSYMTVYTDFFSYRGGVYQHVWGIEEGGHTVTIVGWDDASDCWYVKNSWGPDWGETAAMVSTSPGATDGGWFRIKRGNCNIGHQVEWVQAGLANLTDYPRVGWTYPLVPRNTNDASDPSCALPAALTGNSNTTYWNVSAINNGTQNAPPNEFRFYLDDDWIWYGGWSVWGNGVSATWMNFGPDTVKGGRHTVGVVMDHYDDVWETNETDNTYYRQFVWSPFALGDDVAYTRMAPPKKDTVGSTYYNNEGFSFVVGHDGGGNKWWSAVGILPASSSADYDVRLWDIGDYTGSEQGFGAGYLEWSSYGSAACDFVLVNDNVAPGGTYYAGAINFNAGSGDYRIEDDTSIQITARPGTLWNGPWSKSSTNVLDVYEMYLYANQEYYFLLDQTVGTCDLGMTLYGPGEAHYQKNEYVSGSYANSGGDGGDESFQLNNVTTGWYALVVWKCDSTDYAKSGTYRLAYGAPSITVTAPDGGEAWAVGDNASITWDTFGATGSYVKIELSRNGGSTWSTITSSTANDGLYNWVVTGTTSDLCLIRITSTTTASYTDTSDATFSIGARSITVTAPNGGETWIVGESNTITWTSLNVDGYVKIEVSRDGGSTWSLIILNAINDGSYAWTPTAPESIQCRIRITSQNYPSVNDRSNANFTIGTRSITVTAPNGGETWMVGETNSITWTSENVTGNVKIEVSRNAGSTWSTITLSTANDGSYPWSVTASDSTQCRIRVTSVSYPTAGDTSDANFTIDSRSITVRAPNGGETWIVGETNNITWISENVDGNVKIEITRDGGATWQLIASDTANDGFYSWSVTAPDSTQCRIRVTSVSYPTVGDTSDANFTIGTRLIYVTAPTGGETWLVGETKNITWTSQYITGNVTIEVSCDAGSSWATIVAGTANTGSYSWVVAAPESTQCRIRVTSISYPAVRGMSGLDFTISSRWIDVTLPAGGETWYAGESKGIRWTSQNITGNIKIELTRDGGRSWSTIIASTANSGSYPWTVTGPASSNCQVKASSVSYPTVYDRSLTFRIGQHKIYGTVTLRDWSISPAGVPITFEVRNVGSTTPIETYVIPLDAGGGYSCPVSVHGNYALAGKGGHWLRQTYATVVITGDVLVNFFLTNGDADLGNQVNHADLAIVLAAVDSVPGDRTWSSSADLDGDSAITSTDLAIVLASIDQMGDP